VKKRLLSLLLALLMSCALVACSKSDDAQTSREYGEFYTKDGVLQNTHITLTMDNESLSAPLPVRALSYTLHEKCDFRLRVVDYMSGCECRDLIEIYQNGVWEEVAQCGSGGLSGPVLTVWGGDYAEHDTFQRDMVFYDEEAAHYLCYMPLEPGQYRLRVKYQAYAEDEGVEIPEGPFEAVAYFTVTAPAE